MPGKTVATLRINEVYGPSDYGFYDVKATGEDGDIKLSTKNRDVASEAKGGIGGYWRITYATKINEKDGKTYTNHYLDKVEPIMGEPPPTPAAPSAPAPARGSPEAELRIMRQSALQRAIMAMGPIQKGDDPEQVINTYLALSERFLNYFTHGIPDGDDIPFD